jgi:DNA mismatch endonuclease (patch repair protein)
MPDKFSSETRSRIMSAIRSTGNRSTEARFAAILRKERITGWRRHLPILGRPDFMFVRQHLVVFIDGCFWHGCKTCGHIPKSRQAFWRTKISRNQARDKRYTDALRNRGLIVIRVWEHDLKTESRANRIVARLRRLLALHEPKRKTPFAHNVNCS